MAFDLGLHIDMTPHVADGTLSESEANLRGEVFWGIYMIDQLSSYSNSLLKTGTLIHVWRPSCWGFYLGRPFRTQSENITVAKPEAKSEPTTQWAPYTSISNPEERPLKIYDLSELHLQRLRLVEAMTPVANLV